MPFPFLSEPWIEQARALRDELNVAVGELGLEIRINVTMTDGPSGDAPNGIFFEVTEGRATFDVGRLPEADVDVTMSHAMAKDLLLGGSLDRALHEIVMGEVEVDGDYGKLLEFGGLMATDGALITAEISRRLSAITA